MVGILCAATVGANAVFFCDYASAGNLWRRENYYRTWFPVEIPPESR